MQVSIFFFFFCIFVWLMCIFASLVAIFDRFFAKSWCGLWAYLVVGILDLLLEDSWGS